MLEQLKKNWFVLIVALLLVVATVFYVQDQSKNNVSKKKVDGKQVVFSIAGKNFFAEEYNDTLNEYLGDSAIYQIFERELLSNIETSEDIKSDAKLRSEQMLTYIKQSQGAKGLESMNQELIALGYDGIDNLGEYYENIMKYEALITDYFVENYDRLFKKDVEENKPRLVSHILVRFETKGEPTKEELEKIETVNKELAAGKSFGEVAQTHSDDANSAKENGSIGVVDKNESLVKPFLDAMLLLEKGEVSDWVETDLGRHIIKVEETEFKRLLKNPEYFGAKTEAFSEEVGIAMWNATKTIDIEFVDKDVEKRIKTLLGIVKEEN